MAKRKKQCTKAGKRCNKKQKGGSYSVDTSSTIAGQPVIKKVTNCPKVKPVVTDLTLKGKPAAFSKVSSSPEPIVQAETQQGGREVLKCDVPMHKGSMPERIDSEQFGGAYNFIINPKTNRKVSIYGKLGTKILKNYLNFLKKF